MHTMTKEFLETAFAGESMAHMRYQIFADQAEKAGQADLARMFRAISFAEQVHATNHYRALGHIQEEAENLQTCIDGEHYEVNEMYPVYNNAAEFQDEPQAVLSTHYALEAEKIHEKWYKNAKKTIQADQKFSIGKVQICSVCGHTREGDAPDVCPICGAPRSQFREF